MREEANEADKEATKLSQRINKSKKLFAKLQAIELEGLSPIDKRFVERMLRDMRRNGAGLEDAVAGQVQDLEDKITVLAQRFGKNIDEGQRHLMFSKEELAGLPDDFFASHPADEATGKHKVTTDFPDLDPVLGFCDCRETRKALFITSLQVAYPANELVFNELLELRRKVSLLRGYATYADYQMEITLRKSVDEVSGFIQNLRTQCEGTAKKEFDLLQAELEGLGQLKLGERLARWDHSYALNKYRKKLGGFDVKDMREYFCASNVVKGILDLASELFQVRLVAVDAPVWNPDVLVRDVHSLREPEKALGRLYLDLYPRKDKYSHACAAPIRLGKAPVQGQGTLAEVALVGNVQGGDGARSSFKEATMLFHELGHCFHFLLAGEAQYREFSGFSVEIDFIEAPSQMLEAWIADKSVLKRIAVKESGESIPDHFVEALNMTEDFGNALFWLGMSQKSKASLEFYSVDMPEGKMTKSVFDIWYELMKDWTFWDPLEDDHFVAQWGHMGDYYCSRYYSYAMSKVISRDLISAFKGNLMDPEVAKRYREKVLAPGGSKDGRDLIQDFLGRPLQEETFGEWLAGEL